jgi:integrase
MQKVWFRKSKNAWFATILEAGIQKQIRLVTAPNDKHGKRLAEDQLLKELAARDYSAEKESSAEPVPSWATVTHVVNAFLKHSRGEHAAETADWYRNLLSPFVARFGKLRVTRLRKKHVRSWVKDKGYNPTSAGKAIGALKRAFNWAVEEEHIPRNPIAHVKKPKALSRERTLTPEERQLILSSIRDAAFRRFVNAMTLTGCRPGEVARVTAADADLEAGLWVLKKHKTAKKTGKPRLVYLPPEAVALTRELEAQHADGPLFLNSRGRPWTRGAVRIRFRNLRKKHPELRGVVAYAYRHSFATSALERGVGVAQVAELLGHTSTDMVMRVYSHLDQRVRHMREQAERATRPPAENDCGTHDVRG